MSKTTQNSVYERNSKQQHVRPSIVPASTKPFTLEQELETFGRWVDKPIWIPPQGSSEALAQSMLKKHGIRTAKERRWASVVKKHRSEFTQVREIELRKASIRLPKGKFFVTVTEPKDFDKITDKIPACVQTRLDEFMAGPGRQPGVNISYLKPLCVEVGDELILTSRDDLMAAIERIQNEVFIEYRRLYLSRLPRQVATAAINFGLSIPRTIMETYVHRRKKAIADYHAQLQFRRRKTALRAARIHRKCRTNGCTYEEMLALTSPLKEADVIEQYGIENDLSRAERDRLLRLAANNLPWFVTLSIGAAYLVSLSVAAASPVMVCDPAFVAEMPGSPGVLLKIGHFDEIAGIAHVEI